MQAWLMDDFNGIGGLRLAEAPDPIPQPDEVILQLHYAALNPADRYLAEKQYPAQPRLPHILGRDGMGTVVQAGSGAGDVRVGDRRAILRGEVGGNRPGTFAQRVAVPAQDLVEIPAGWSDREAAGATLVYLTAYQALTMWGPLPPSAVVLVTGASGGVGVAAVQLAAAMGYKVLGLSRNPEKSRRLEQLGATATFNPEDPHGAWMSRLLSRRAGWTWPLTTSAASCCRRSLRPSANLAGSAWSGALPGRFPASTRPPCSSAASAWGASRSAPGGMPKAGPPGSRSWSCSRAPAPGRKWTRCSPLTNCPRPSSAWPGADAAKCCLEHAAPI